MSKCAYIVHLSFLLEKRRGGRVEPHMKFSKKRGGGLTGPHFLREFPGKEGVTFLEGGWVGMGGAILQFRKKKKICIGGLPKKRGTWTVCRFKGGSW